MLKLFFYLYTFQPTTQEWEAVLRDPHIELGSDLQKANTQSER